MKFENTPNGETNFTPINCKPLLECKEPNDNFRSENEFGYLNKKLEYLLDTEFEIPLNINKENVRTDNFILTDNAIKKLKEIKYYFSHNYPVLLEGPTGTSKKKSVEIICEEMGLTLKRLNLSSETKTVDLFVDIQEIQILFQVYLSKKVSLWKLLKMDIFYF